MKCLIVVYSYHHMNTAKVADVFGNIMEADVVTPDNVNVSELSDYDLIGFGAGIDSGMHYKPILDLANNLPFAKGLKCFIFSTSAIQGEEKVYNDHSKLRDKLTAKGYTVEGEFSCKGFNTNSFLKFFGGMNKGRPNSEDLENAKTFATELLERID